MDVRKSIQGLLILALLFIVCCVTGMAAAEEGDFYTDESELRTLLRWYDEAGLTLLKIQMHDDQATVFVRDHFPQHVLLDMYHDANDILMDYYGGMPEGPFDSRETRLELHWFMTFRYEGEAWRLVDFTNGETWMARVEHGVYTFDDYYDSDPAWQWSIVYDDRLETVDFAKLSFLVELYTLQKPDRPSLLEDW